MVIVIIRYFFVIENIVERLVAQQDMHQYIDTALTVRKLKNLYCVFISNRYTCCAG